MTIRPIRPEDEPLLVAFHRTLSEESVYLRWFHMMSLNHRIAHERLVRICFTDYDGRWPWWWTAATPRAAAMRCWRWDASAASTAATRPSSRCW